MTYNNKAKIKVLYLLKILQEETDAEHGLTMTQILTRLAEYGVSAERKSIYDDIKALREFDIDIRTYQRNPVEYAIERRDFTLEELMLMVDCVQSCQAITTRQANALVLNIKQLANNREQALLNGRIHVPERIKSKNDSVLGIVDLIHAAQRKGRQLGFSYRKIGIDGKPYKTREGKEHTVTPIAVEYEGGFYYLVSWDEFHDGITQYRLDRMAHVRVLNDVRGVRNDEIAHYKTDDKKAKMFGRFGGEEVIATLETKPDAVEIITDFFGTDATFLAPKHGNAQARVKVYKSPQFFGWVASMDNAVRIVAPKSLMAEYRAYLTHLLEE